jgi:hypothetical protein
MAKNKEFFSNFDSPYETQPPKGSAEPGIVYGGVTQIPEAQDPLGVMPEADQKNIGPKS